MVLERNGKPLGDLTIMSIENPTLAHFRHFSSLFTNDLRSTKDYVRNYILFLQNEPKFRKSQMNVTSLITADYEIETLSGRGKNEPKTNPNEPKFKKAKKNVTTIITKGYENKPPIRASKKQSQMSKRQKPMHTS